MSTSSRTEKAAALERWAEELASEDLVEVGALLGVSNQAAQRKHG